MQNVATNQVRLIADGSRAGSAETDTTCDCTRSEFFHIKLEKCFFVHVFISAECEQCDKHSNDSYSRLELWYKLCLSAL